MSALMAIMCSFKLCVKPSRTKKYKSMNAFNDVLNISVQKNNSKWGRAGVISITKQESVASANVKFDGAGPAASLDLEPEHICSNCKRGYQFYGCLLGSSLLSGLGKKLFGPSVDSKFVSMRKA